VLTMAKLGWGLFLVVPVGLIALGITLLMGGHALGVPFPYSLWVGIASIAVGLLNAAIPCTALAMLSAQQEGLELNRRILMAVINVQPNHAAARIEPRLM
jgi:hypothetical protein